MAVFGVLKPRPTSLYQRRPPLPTALDFPAFFEPRKMWGCFCEEQAVSTSKTTIQSISQ
jgi:hypothetical protein